MSGSTRGLRSRRSRLAPIAALVGFGLLAAACGGGESKQEGEGPQETTASGDKCNVVCTVALEEPDTEPVPGGSLSFAVAAETDKWNPSTALWAGSGNLISTTFFDRLAMYDQDGNAQPYLAESIESNEEFTIWTIKLREGIKFHDDSDLDAEAVIANLEAQRKSVQIGPVFRLIESMEVDPADPSGLTVKLTMTGPWSTFPHILTAQPGSIASVAMLEGGEETSGEPVGTGPFKFVSWERDSTLVVERNENYWREGYPLLDRIEFTVVTDPDARSSALEAGNVDMIESAEATTVKDYYDKALSGGFQIYLQDEGDTDENFVIFNTAKEPFNDPKFRLGAIMAINTEDVNDQVYEGIFTPARGFISPESPWYAETEYPEYNPTEAKKMVDEWEAENGKEMAFTANITPDPAVLQIGQLMKSLAAEVGVDVELVTLEQTVLIVRAISGDYEATGFTTIFNVTHPDRAYAFLHSSSIPEDPLSKLPSLNFARYANPKVDAALDGARTTADFDEQYEYYKDLQVALAEDTPYLWMVHVRAAVIAHNSVRGTNEWEFPDGTPGKRQVNSHVMLYQVWRDQ